MKIGIIGMGYVGDAVASSLPADSIVCYDPFIRSYEDNFEEVKSSDAVILCLPTPTRYDGSCNTSILHKTLDKLNEGKTFDGVIISKSTAPPTYYANAQTLYKNLVHVPEFLRASSAKQDYENSPFAIYGGDYYWTTKAQEVLTLDCYKPKKHIHTSIKIAATYKYLANSYLATKVVWMNEFKQLADAIGIEWNSLISCCGVDARIGIGHTQVPGPDGKFGYGGACFPKDVSAIISLAKEHNVELSVLESVVAKNDKIRQ